MAKSRAGAALVAVILIAAFAIRFAYVENTSYRAVNDAGTYNRLGGMIARTGDYDTGSKPGSGAGGSRGPTAYFPPGFPYFLAAVDIVDGHTAAGKSAIEPARVAQAVLGTVAVGFVGLVGLEAFGVSVALVCMVLAALYPVLIELSGTLVAENLLVVLMLAAIWTALRARRSEHPYAWLAATGVLTGLATLTHQNAFVILLPLAFAAVAATRARSRAPSTIAYSKVTVGSTGARGQGGRHPPPQATRRASPVGAVVLLVGMTVLTIAPWTIRNALQLHHFIPVSDETGITLVGTYNPQSAEFSAVPYKWRFFWKIPEDNNLRHHLRNLSEPRLEREARITGAALHRRSSAVAAGGRVPQHAADVRDRGHVRVARISRCDRRPGADRGRWRDLVLAAVHRRGARDRDPHGTRGSALDLGDPAVDGAHGRFHQRRDTEVPRTDRSVPGAARRMRDRGCAGARRTGPRVIPADLATGVRRLAPGLSQASGLGGAPVGRRRQPPRLVGDPELVQMRQRLP